MICVKSKNGIISCLPAWELNGTNFCVLQSKLPKEHPLHDITLMNTLQHHIRTYIGSKATISGKEQASKTFTCGWRLYSNKMLKAGSVS